MGFWNLKIREALWFTSLETHLLWSPPRTNSETQTLNGILSTLEKLNSHVLDLALVLVLVLSGTKCFSCPGRGSIEPWFSVLPELIISHLVSLFSYILEKLLSESGSNAIPGVFFLCSGHRFLKSFRHSKKLAEKNFFRNTDHLMIPEQVFCVLVSDIFWIRAKTSHLLWSCSRKRNSTLTPGAIFSTLVIGLSIV